MEIAAFLELIAQITHAGFEDPCSQISQHETPVIRPRKEHQETMSLILTGVFGLVGLVLSYGFFVPPELSAFRLIAPVGVMAGYQAGQLVGRLIRPRPKRFLILSVGILFCFYFAFAYIQLGAASPSDIANLSALFGLSFFWLGFFLPFTRAPNEMKILWSKAVEAFGRRSRD